MKASKVLIVLVCLAVSVTCGVLYVAKYVYQQDILPATASTRTVAKALDAGADPLPDTGIGTSTDTSAVPTVVAPVPTVVYSVLPRQPYTYDGVTCNVTGAVGQESVLDYYAFGGYVYAVICTDSNGQDYRAQGDMMAVARFDEACVLVDTVTLPQSSGYSYLCASLCDYGLMIAAAGEGKVRLWLVSANMTVRTVSFDYVATRACMLYQDGRTLLALTGDRLHLLCLSADMQLTWYHSTDNAAQQAVALYAIRGVYLVVCSSRTAGSAFSFDAGGYIGRAILPVVDAICPYAGGFAVATLGTGKLQLVDYDFAFVGEMDFGSASSAAVCSYAKGILLMTGGDAPTGYLLCNHGELQFSFALPNGVGFGSLQMVGGCFYYARQDDSAVTVYRYRPFDSAPVAAATFVGAANPLVWVAGRYVYCLCDSVFDYGYFSGSLGGKDVYLLRMGMSN